MSEPLYSLFFAKSESTVTPTDVVEHNKIVIVDVDVKSFGLAGKIAGCIWKRAMQMAIENRPGLDGPQESVTPCFIYGDEMQNWLVTTPMHSDAEYQATCRSARGITIACTQSTAAFYAECGADPSSRARVDHLLTNFGTLISCNNNAEQSKWFSEAVGQIVVERGNGQDPAAGGARDPMDKIAQGLSRRPRGFTEVTDYDVPSRAFVGLRTASDDDRRWGDAIVFAGGARFKTGAIRFKREGRRWLKVHFRRNSPERSFWWPRKVFIALGRS